MKQQMMVSQEGESGVLRQLLWVGVVTEGEVRSEKAVSQQRMTKVSRGGALRCRWLSRE